MQFWNGYWTTQHASYLSSDLQKLHRGEVLLGCPVPLYTIWQPKEPITEVRGALTQQNQQAGGCSRKMFQKSRNDEPLQNFSKHFKKNKL